MMIHSSSTCMCTLEGVANYVTIRLASELLEALRKKVARALNLSNRFIWVSLNLILQTKTKLQIVYGIRGGTS